MTSLLRQRLQPTCPGSPPRQQSPDCAGVSLPNGHRGSPSVGSPPHWVLEAESQQRTAHQGGEAVTERRAAAQDRRHHNRTPMYTTLHSLHSSVPREASFHPQGRQEGWELASPSYPGNRRPGDIKSWAQEPESGPSTGDSPESPPRDSTLPPGRC